MVQVRDGRGFPWAVISEDGEKQEVWRNVLELEWQDMLVDLTWRMRESKTTLRVGLSHSHGTVHSLGI